MNNNCRDCATCKDKVFVGLHIDGTEAFICRSGEHTYKSYKMPISQDPRTRAQVDAVLAIKRLEEEKGGK